MREFRRRRREEGRYFWARPDVLAVLDPQAAQELEARNYADLTMLDGFVDILRGRRSTPVDWQTVRSGWLTQMRRLTSDDALRALSGRMAAVLDAEVGRTQDLLWLAERATIEPLVPTIIDGLSPTSRRIVTSEILSRVAWTLSDVGKPLTGHFHKTKMILQQILSGQVVRRELQGRASGKRPRQRDLIDPIVDLLPELGIGRGVDAATALFAAVTGSPGAASACLMFEMHRHPVWRERMEAELADVSLETLCASPTRHAPVTARFVKEVLRIWSSPPIVVRPVRTEIAHGDYTLKPGQFYSLSNFLLHHDARDWSDPEAFDPDRWLSGAQRDQCPRGTYVPFGWAPKSCVGASLGMAQLILLAHLLCTRHRLRIIEPGRMAVASLVRPVGFEGSIEWRHGAPA
jgi:hypothetical protein